MEAKKKWRGRCNRGIDARFGGLMHQSPESPDLAGDRGIDARLTDDW